MDKFREKAQFTVTDLRKAIGTDESLIPMEEFVKLLKYHNILALRSKCNSESVKKEDDTYFMPCILKSAKPSELQETSCPEAAPLIVRYDCGYVPLGMFCSMVIDLLSKEGWEVYDLKMMYRNKIQFQVGDDYSSLTLIGHPDYLEVVLTKRNGEVNQICNFIRQTIDNTLTKVASCQNYHSNTKFKFGFKCQCNNISEEHFCVMKKRLCCLRTKRVVQLQASQKVWFEVSELYPYFCSYYSQSFPFIHRLRHHKEYQLVSLSEYHDSM